ncbi:MAG: ABC transporter ATP-binding protein [Candidatus Bipolaricaulota bacterium]
MIFLELAGLSKRFGSVVAVDDFSISVEQGELVTLIGPSGCGKTTILRIIAGLEATDAGHVFLRGKEVTHTPPEARTVGLVFQSYALFPHLSVERNVSYGLRGLPRRERRQRTAELLHLVGLEDYARRRPHQLSQGQKQRVALARALAPQPDVLLLDEPLAALDAALRISLRSELNHMLRQLGVTTLYITHDQAEALALADRLAVMHSGALEQAGPPQQVYLYPETPFVARFLGRANLWPAEVEEVHDGQAVVKAGGQTFNAPAGWARPGDSAYLFFRPEDVQSDGSLAFQVVEAEYQGDRWEVQARRQGLEVLVYLPTEATPGAQLHLSFPASRLQLLPIEAAR